MKNTMLLHQVRQQWRTLSPVLVKHASVVSVQNKVLTLGVYSATWKQELMLMTPTILRRVAQWIPEGEIQTIQFTLLKRKKKRQKKSLVIKASTLEASIQYTHDARKASGQQLCKQCLSRYTPRSICTVCQSKQQYQEFRNLYVLCNNLRLFCQLIKQ